MKYDSKVGVKWVTLNYFGLVVPGVGLVCPHKRSLGIIL
jgi:hypothetical protein